MRAAGRYRKILVSGAALRNLELSRMYISRIWPSAYARMQRLPGKSLVSLFPAIVLLLSASLLVALETPSKPFLDKNSFYLSSAGFRVQLANDAEGKKALRALPPHRFVVHNLGNGDVRYLYAEPLHCVCVFIGTRDAYSSYRAILSQPMPQADDVAPDYRTQTNALLVDDPVDIVGQPPYAAEYFRNYY
jgi:hypothetical protein